MPKNVPPPEVYIVWIDSTNVIGGWVRDSKV